MNFIFASDNCAATHPSIMKALAAANEGAVLSYGDDEITRRAIAAFEDEFGHDVDVYFVYNGTGANTLALGAVVRPYQAVITPEFSHIAVDETGAPEQYIGCKLLTCPTPDGKLRISDIAPHLAVKGVMHHSQPVVVSITNPTEEGTLYTIEELTELCDYAHRNGLLVHMDGARIGNAAAALDASLRAITRDCGVDILSFGGTKGGMMFGEAVIFMNKELGRDFIYIRKNGTQLHSKMRYIAAQFEVYLKERLYFINGYHANVMCRYLYEQLKPVEGVEFVAPPRANGLFLRMPEAMEERIQSTYFFYDMDTQGGKVCRLMCSYMTTKDDVDQLVQLAKGDHR